jgi:hypothetical protein
MVSGRSEINDGVITKFKINNDLTSDFIVDKLGLYANDTNDVNIISRAVISKLDKSVIILPSAVFTPAPFSLNNTRNDTQNDTQDTTKTQEKTQGGLIYAKNQLQITAANHLLLAVMAKLAWAMVSLPSF